MRKRENPSHLRLLETKQVEAKEAPRSRGIKERQLAFPYPETTMVFLVLVTSFEAEGFSRMLGELNPRWVIDVRAVPRLDTIAASRKAAFSLFEKRKVSYVDLFGRLEIKSYGSAEANPAFWRAEIMKLLAHANEKGPYFLLFDSEPLMEAAKELLLSPVRTALGRSAEISCLKSQDSQQNADSC